MTTLGQIGERKSGDPGEGPLRKPRRRELVAKRVAAYRERCAPKCHKPGVTPLNGGFFELERMRAEKRAKPRAVKEVKVRGR